MRCAATPGRTRASAIPAAASGTRAPRPSRKEERRVLRAAEGLEMLIFYLILDKIRYKIR